MSQRNKNHPPNEDHTDLKPLVLTDARLLSRQENGIATRGEASGSQSRKVARRPRVVDPNAPRRPPSMTGFNKLHYLSTDLSAVCGGVAALSRPQVTKALWVRFVLALSSGKEYL